MFIGGRPRRHDIPALTAALLTGVMIAAYTVVDGLGVMEAPLAAYIGWMFLLQGPPIAVLALIRRRGRLGPALRESAGAGITGGVISLAAYSIVLWAQTSGALAPIAALRETSIVFRGADRDGVPGRAARQSARDRVGGGAGRSGADQRRLTSASIAAASAACASSADISPGNDRPRDTVGRPQDRVDGGVGNLAAAGERQQRFSAFAAEGLIRVPAQAFEFR